MRQKSHKPGRSYAIAKTHKFSDLEKTTVEKLKNLDQLLTRQVLQCMTLQK